MKPITTKNKKELLEAILEGRSFTFQYFWGVNDIHKNPEHLGCFSQWSSHQVTYDNQTFNCVEQAMIVKKAEYFGDYQAAADISQITKPIDMKVKIKGLDKAVWKAIQFELLVDINLAKFNQHPTIQKTLLDTGNAVLVGACTYDTNLGIGTHETRAATLTVDQWEGDNVLGFVLMEVRRILSTQNNEGREMSMGGTKDDDTHNQ